MAKSKIFLGLMMALVLCAVLWRQPAKAEKIQFDELLGATQEGQTMILQQDVAEDATIDKNLTLDLNGFSVAATLTVADGCTVYVQDSQTDDFTVEDPEGYGTIAAFFGKVLPKDGYMQVTQEAGVSFHRVRMALTSMTLRPECAGVYYNAAFSADEVAAENVKWYGIALRVGQAPDAAYMKRTNAYSWFRDFVPGEDVNTATGSLLKNVMVTGLSAQENDTRAKLKIYGSPYIMTMDGQYLFGECACRSFMEQVQAADALWGTLDATQKQAIRALYSRFSSVMENWYLPNMNDTDIDVPI